MSETQLVPVKQKGKSRIRIPVGRLFVMLLGLCAFLFVAYLGTFNFFATSKNCVKCHEMKPEYDTWKASSHSQFDCLQCHEDPGVVGTIKVALKGLSIFKTHMTRPDDTPIKVNHAVKNYVCSDCHSKNRKATPSGDLIIPHDRHAAKGVECIACHSGIAHGNIVERNARANIDLADWDLRTGANQMITKNISPPMDACLNCHSLRNVTTKCSICHSQVIIPSTHKTPTWLNEGQHGIDARNGGIRECHKCHSYTFKGSYKPFGMNVTQYIKQNEFCLDCHSTKRPPSHLQSPAQWMPTHFYRAYKKGLGNCTVCHDLNKPQVITSNTNKVYCNECHWFTPNSPLK